MFLIKFLIVFIALSFSGSAYAGMLDKHSMFKDGSTISDIKVTIGPEIKSLDTIAFMKNNNLLGLLEKNFAERLKKHMQEDGNLKLDVVIRNIRMTPVGSTLLVAGSDQDTLTIDVLVMKNGRPYKEFKYTAGDHLVASSVEAKVEPLAHAVGLSIRKYMLGQIEQSKIREPWREPIAFSSVQDVQLINAKSTEPQNEVGEKNVEVALSEGKASAKDRLTKLKDLYESELITKDEYQQQKRKILSGI